MGAGSGSPDPAYNPYTNDFWTMPYTNSSPGRVTMQVTPTGGSVFNVMTNEPHDTGTFPIEWDGRDDFGDKIGKGVYSYRVKVKSTEGGTAEKYEKLVILN